MTIDIPITLDELNSIKGKTINHTYSLRKDALSMYHKWKRAESEGNYLEEKLMFNRIRKILDEYSI